VVYGNRDYGIALRRLVEILSQADFTIVSAGTFIGQHSYSDVISVAVGRPDSEDLAKAKSLGNDSIDVSDAIEVGDVPVKIDKASSSDEYTALKPTHIAKNCVQCGTCAKHCTVGVISAETGRYKDRSAKAQCIGCIACVRVCPNEGRIVKANLLVKAVMGNILGKASRIRREPFTMIAGN